MKSIVESVSLCGDFKNSRRCLLPFRFGCTSSTRDGLAAGNILVENAQNKTFGVTIARFAKAGLVTPELQRRPDHLLGERNWLVHNSRASSRNAVQHDAASMKLLAGLDLIAEESLGFLKEISGRTGHFVKKHGVTEGQIPEGTKRASRVAQSRCDITKPCS